MQSLKQKMFYFISLFSMNRAWSSMKIELGAFQHLGCEKLHWDPVSLETV